MSLEKLQKVFWEDKIDELANATFLKYERDKKEPRFTTKEYEKWIKEVNLSKFGDMVCISKPEDSTFCVECKIQGKNVINICPNFFIIEFVKGLAYGFTKSKSLKGFYKFAEKFSALYLENLPKWEEVQNKFLKENDVE